MRLRSRVARPCSRRSRGSSRTLRVGAFVGAERPARRGVEQPTLAGGSRGPELPACATRHSADRPHPSTGPQREHIEHSVSTTRARRHERHEGVRNDPRACGHRTDAAGGARVVARRQLGSRAGRCGKHQREDHSARSHASRPTNRTMSRSCHGSVRLVHSLPNYCQTAPRITRSAALDPPSLPA